MTNRVIASETADSRWHGLYKICGAVASILGALFLLAMIGLIIAGLQPDSLKSWFALFQDNWLVVLFQLNAGSTGVRFDSLYGVNALDLVILVLVAALYLGLGAALWRTSRILSVLAVVQPFIGIVLFIATQIAGRSAVMGAGLVISLVMLRSHTFGKVIAGMGILSSILLLIGDMGTSTSSHSMVIASLIAIGYMLLVAWFFLVARAFFALGSREPGTREDTQHFKAPVV